MTFESLRLIPEILKALNTQGYVTPTPIQAQAIPVILEGRDLIAGSQTGTGKTAAFTLPLLQKLAPFAQRSSDASQHPIRALILTPTRELALQVEESVRVYGAGLNLRSTTIFGGVNIKPQIKALRAGVEIVVATPGRLLDHYQQGTLNFSQLKYLILDEADRMLDMGFIRDVRKIISYLPPQRQNLLFSATFEKDVRDLASSLLKNPATIDVATRNSGSELIRHTVHPVDRVRKHDLLTHLFQTQNLQQVLVFTRTKHMANSVADHLNRAGIPSAAIHGNKSQHKRTQALSDFKGYKIQCLVATDIAARGLDIDQLPHVINFELPHVPEDYVHRSGRTGRAGSEGDALSLVCIDEHKLLKDIERLMKKSLDVVPVAGFAPDPRIKAEPIINGRSGGGRRSPPRHSAPSAASKHRPPQRSSGRPRA